MFLSKLQRYVKYTFDDLDISWNTGEEPETIASTKRSYDMMASSHKTRVAICEDILGGVELDYETKDFLQHVIQRHTTKLRDERSEIEGVNILSPGRFIINQFPSVVFSMPVFNESIPKRWDDIKTAAEIFTKKKSELSHLVLPQQSLILVERLYLIVEKRLRFDYKSSSHEQAYYLNANTLTFALAQLTKFVIWSGFRFAHPNTVPVLMFEMHPDEQRRIGLMNFGDCGVGTLSMHSVKEGLPESIQGTLEMAFCQCLVKFVHPGHFDIIYEAALSEGVDLKTMFPSPEGWEQACNDRQLAVENRLLSQDLFDTIKLCVDINDRYFKFIGQSCQTLQTVRLKLGFDLEVPIRAFRSDGLIGVLFANEDSNVVSIILQSVRHLDDAPAVLKAVLSEEGEVITSVKRMSPAEGLCLLVRRYDERLPEFVKIHHESGFPITTDWSL